MIISDVLQLYAKFRTFPIYYRTITEKIPGQAGNDDCRTTFVVMADLPLFSSWPT